MLETIHLILKQASDIVWGLPMIVLLLGTGIFYTFRLRGLQFTKLFKGLRIAFIERTEKGAIGDISHLQALMTALAATVGVGNIAGVATAISVGGPGALFWMWMTGLVGMVTKYAEAVLAVKYREQDKNGNMCGGPMYYISNGLKMPWLGVLFAVFTAIATFGIGDMVQSNTVAQSLLTSPLKIPVAYTGIFLTIATAVVILGGIKRIAKTATFLVPFMVTVYFLAALAIIIMKIDIVPRVLWLVMRTAFVPQAAVGGFMGATLKMVIQKGVSRGIFSNESGLGSAPIAAAAAKTKEPVRQALVSMTQTFIDTIVVCTLTGLVILLTGAWKTGKTGAELTSYAFGIGLPGDIGMWVVTLGLILFAYSTLVGWGYYGEKAMEYLFGMKVIFPYRIAFCIFVYIGAVVKLDLVWSFSDVANALMAMPNLIGLIFLSGVVVKETNDWLSRAG